MFGTLQQSDPSVAPHIVFGLASMPPERAVKLGATLLQPFRPEITQTVEDSHLRT